MRNEYEDKNCKKQEYKASLTVEAAFVVPISFWAMYLFLYLFMYMHTQFLVYQGMLAVSDRLYGYGTTAAYCRNSGILSGLFTTGDSEIEQEIGEKLSKEAMGFLTDMISDNYIQTAFEDYFRDNGKNLNCVDGGYRGVSCDNSFFYSGDEKIVIQTEYTLEIPFGILLFKTDKTIEQTLMLNGFYGTGWDLVKEFKKEPGKEAEEETGDYVYVTRNGQVYHEDRDCTYISITIAQVLYENIDEERNASGAKYYPCEYCAQGRQGINVYVTEYGTRYHNDPGCSQIHRDVERITKSEAEAQGKRACSKCSSG
ncbi:MAG: hypothetical protein ACI39R_09025 [Lachnospiraceae bacterium]